MRFRRRRRSQRFESPVLPLEDGNLGKPFVKPQFLHLYIFRAGESLGSRIAKPWERAIPKKVRTT